MAGETDKYNFKDKGLKLEKEDPIKAIEFYEGLLNHEYFINDYYPYRRLVMLYKKTKQPEKKTEIIRTFFKSGIYCNNHQFLWFKNKLKALSKKDYISKEEIKDLTECFSENSLPNKDQSNTPLPIAERIRKSNGRIIVESEEKYDKIQKQYEYEEVCSQLNREKKYEEYAALLNHMIDDLGYNRYRYFQKLCIVYRRLGDYDNEARVIEKYNRGESTKTKVSDEWFSNRSQTMEKPEKSESKPESDFKEKSVYEIPFTSEELDVTKTPIFEYDDDLNEFENLKRKNHLIQHGKALIEAKQYNNAILFYKYLSNNTYFSNDWYPYRQLCILYEKTEDYSANLVNIKKLLYSKIYLNQYQFIWFGEKIRQLMEKTEISDYKIKEWLDYYEFHGRLKEKKLNKYLADKFRKDGDKIFILNDDEFDYTQERYVLEETGAIYERVGNYELAINHYTKIIREKEFNFYRFYQRLCCCLEKINDYDLELKAIRLYYTQKPADSNETTDKWFENRLKIINDKLNTSYTVDDLRK